METQPKEKPHTMKATHILFAEGLQTRKLTFSVKPITEDWHTTCNNFKGSEQECIAEGEKRRKEAIEFFKMRDLPFVASHYNNVSYESIFDY